MDLKSALSRDGITLDDQFFDYVARYKAHLMKWNKVHNLTGAKSEDELDYFIYDAVYPVKFLPKVQSLMDIGTGAGFPGMILAMALPETKVTLVEPLKKRSSFLQFVKADLGLDNVEVKSCRVEELPPCSFELVTSRAVTDTQLLLKLSAPYTEKGSLLLFYKGEKVFDEVSPELNHQVIQTEKRHYLLIEK
jgi:16S rRNA (guanine527-N7)-methyltransferase